MRKGVFFSKVLYDKPRPFFSFSLLHSTTTQFFKSTYDIYTCIASLQSCAKHENLCKGQQIHSYMLINDFLNSPVCITSLINMYSKCCRMNDAIWVFNYPFHERNVFAYNAIIAGFIANGLSIRGFEFYKQMREVGIVPDKFTLPCVIRACFDVVEVRKIHGLLFKLGLELDVFVGSALVNTYLKFGLMEEAQKLFVELPVKDVVLWNAMVNGFAQIGQIDEALEVFRTMGRVGVVPGRFTVTGVLSIYAIKGGFDNGRSVHGFVIKMGYDSGVAVLNALIDLYGKCKCTKDALEIFEMMEEKDIYSWNSILTVHEQCGDHEDTLRLFDRMLGAGVFPDLVTVTTVLPACSHLAARMHGRQIHGYIIRNGFGEDCKDMLVNNAVMDMYAKCGSMTNAYGVFDQMRNKDVASWNIMVMGYGTHGYANEALNMFSCMCEAQLKADEVTFVGVLCACNHAGLWKQGCDFLADMESKHGVVPTIEHYTCLIDMLGRAGKLQEAYNLIQTMPIDANPIAWKALLASCRLHGNADLAEVALQKVVELDPGHCGSYVLMSNIYGEAGRYKELSELRHTMRTQNVKKKPGCSWIELQDGVHTFITGDKAHPDADLIHAELLSLTVSLREHGYVPHI